MKLIKSKKANVNYLAKTVYLNDTDFTPHPNADALKIAHIGGYNVIVGLNEKSGLYIYFPALSQINENLLSYNNLYRHKEKNTNPETKTGFFDDNGRVKAIKLRGVISEGFLLPAESLRDFLLDSLNIEFNNIESNIEFDSVEHDGKELWICKKYVIRNTPGTLGSKNCGGKVAKGFDRIDENQFKFHYNTIQVKKEPWCISPDDIIQISEKIHGTSGISAYVLCKKPLMFWNKFGNLLLGRKWNDENKYYDYIYASRTVIKNRYINKNVGFGYYGVDVWAEADKVVRPHLQKGMTMYYEIIGFLPNGSYIQKNYDYGCIAPKEGEIYTPEKHFKVRIYRITLTNADGQVHEFSTQEVQRWCALNGLMPVTEFYYGKAIDLYPELVQIVNSEDPLVPENWNQLFWDKLANDKDFFMECNSPSCNNKVPHEGLVIKKDDMIPRAWKLKSWSFLSGEQKELDSGEFNIEDEN